MGRDRERQCQWIMDKKKNDRNDSARSNTAKVVARQPEKGTGKVKRHILSDIERKRHFSLWLSSRSYRATLMIAITALVSLHTNNIEPKARIVRSHYYKTQLAKSVSRQSKGDFVVCWSLWTDTNNINSTQQQTKRHYGGPNISPRLSETCRAANPSACTHDDTLFNIKDNINRQIQHRPKWRRDSNEKAMGCGQLQEINDPHQA